MLSDLTNLQLFGVALAALSAVLSVMAFLVRQRDRMGLTLGLLLSAVILAVAVHPPLLTPLAELFSLGEVEGGRLIVALILGFVALTIALGVERKRRVGLGLKVDALVRQLALRATPETQPASAPGVLVLIPIFNERDNIGGVLDGVPDTVLGLPVTVLVVDDASTDAPHDEVTARRAHVVHHPTRLGGGAALQTGFEVARRLRPECVVTLDGDGQHQPGEIATLVEPILNGEADVVIGSRALGRSFQKSLLRRVGVFLFSGIVSVLVKRRVTDCTSGFRAFSPRFLEHAALYENQYHTVEAIFEAGRLDMPLVERPIQILERHSGQSKKGRELSYAADFSYSLFKNWLRRWSR